MFKKRQQQNTFYADCSDSSGTRSSCNCNRRGFLAFAVVIIVAGLLTSVLRAQTDDQTEAEYKLKAAFIYNFTKFVTWPGDAFEADSEQGNDEPVPIVIAVLGDRVCRRAFAPLAEKKVRGRPIEIEFIQRPNKTSPGNAKDIEEFVAEHKTELLKSHLIFVSRSEQACSKQLMKLVRGRAILTVGETESFAEGGGIFEFVKLNRKIRFQVNLTAAKKADLNISSKLLSLAVKVISRESDEERE